MNEIIMNNSKGIVTDKPMTKDEALQQYVDSHVDELDLRGYEDAGASRASCESLRMSLLKVKGEYLAWCAKMGQLYKDSVGERVGNYRSLLEESRSKEERLDGEKEDIQQKVLELKSQLEFTKGRSFLSQDLMKLLANVAAVALVCFWVVFFYSSAFKLWQAVPADLVDSGKNIVLFTLDNIKFGWRFSMIPVSVAVAIGLFMRDNVKMRMATSAAFAVMDLLFSVSIEQHLVSAYQYIGVDYSFSWLNVGLILFYGLIPSYLLAFFMDRIYDSVMFDSSNAGRAECRTLEDKIADQSSALSALLDEKGHTTGQRAKLEAELERLKRDDITTLWYTGWVLDMLLTAYYNGYLKYVNARPDMSEDSTSAKDIVTNSKRVFDEVKAAA